jgi:DNA-binding transcriptional MocR family regulator
MKQIVFTRGVPAEESFPVEEIVAAAGAILRERGASLLQYGPALGFAPLREWLAEWQGVRPDQILTGNGSLELVEFLCRHLIEPGDVVFTERPTYDRTVTLLRRHRAAIVDVPLEADGPDVDFVEKRLKERVPKFFYVIPDFQNPTGITASTEKRRRIAELASRYGFLILEDSPYRLLRYAGREEPTLRRLAPDRTLHMTSFTKLIAPGVRVGFMVGDRDLLAKVAKVAEDTYISPGYAAHGITYEWCRRGLLGPQVEKLKRLYAPRLEACLDALDRHMPGQCIARPEGGFFVSLFLPDGVSTTAVRESAARLDLVLSDGRAFFPNGGGERFLRLPYCALSPDQIREGIARLAQAIEQVFGGS